VDLWKLHFVHLQKIIPNQKNVCLHFFSLKLRLLLLDTGYHFFSKYINFLFFFCSQYSIHFGILHFVLGFLISTCFYAKAADTEAARGHRGSAKLRIEAFTTLRVLVAKVILSLSVPNSYGF